MTAPPPPPARASVRMDGLAPGRSFALSGTQLLSGACRQHNHYREESYLVP